MLRSNSKQYDPNNDPAQGLHTLKSGPVCSLVNFASCRTILHTIGLHSKRKIETHSHTQLRKTNTRVKLNT